MKTWKRIQKVAIAVGMIYGLWLGCNVDATGKDSINGMVIVALAVVLALSLLMPEAKQEENL